VPTKNPASRPAKTAKRKKAAVPARRPPAGQRSVPRAFTGYEDDDVLMSGGSIRGLGFGRCGGRVLGSKLEQQICDLLSEAGLTHSHSPRHFEVPVRETAVAAYAPLIVLRGRGRGGKTVVVEAMEQLDKSVLEKIVAFRAKFGLEFYVIFVAPEETIDLIPLAAYDESSVTTDLGTLINRLAD
jgi:hypothetical protein